MALSPDGKRLATRGEGDLELWDVDLGNNATPLKPESKEKLDIGHNMVTMSYSPDGNYLFAAERGGYGIGKIWRVSKGLEVIEVARTTHSTRVAVFSPDGRWFFAGGENGEIIKCMATNDKEAGRLYHGGGVNSIAFSSDGKWLATASDDRIVRIFDASRWSEVTRLEHKGEVRKVDFIQGGGRLITATATAIRVFKVGENWRQLVQIEPKEPILTKVTISPDGKYLATWSRLESSASETKWMESQKVWELDKGQPVASALLEYELIRGRRGRSGGKRLLQDTSEGLTKAASAWQELKLSESSNNPVSPSGQLRAEIDRNSVRLLETIDQTIVANVGHEATDRAFSPDGRWLVTASKDGAVRLWPLWSEGLIRDACARLPRNLSKKEWKKYFGATPYRETCPGFPAPEE